MPKTNPLSNVPADPYEAILAAPNGALPVVHPSTDPYEAILAAPDSGSKPASPNVAPYSHSTDLHGLADAAADRHGVDRGLFRALVGQESSWNPRAVSKAGAQGLVQLMPGTAKGLGVANPFDPKQSLDGGARYLRGMLDRFGGDARLALAAYNAGEGNVRKYRGVPPFKETQAYVAKLLPALGGRPARIRPTESSAPDRSQTPKLNLQLQSAEEKIRGLRAQGDESSSRYKELQRIQWETTQRLATHPEMSATPPAMASAPIGGSVETRRAALDHDHADFEAQRTRGIASLGVMSKALGGFQGPRNAKIAAERAAIDAEETALGDQQSSLDPSDPDAVDAYNEAFLANGRRIDAYNALVRDTQDETQAKIGRIQGTADAFRRNDAARVARYNAGVNDLDAAIRRAQAQARAAAQVARANAARSTASPDAVRRALQQRLAHFQNVSSHAMPGQGDAEASRQVFQIGGLLEALKTHPDLAGLLQQQADVAQSLAQAGPGQKGALQKRVARLNAAIVQRAPNVTLAAYRNALRPSPPRYSVEDVFRLSKLENDSDRPSIRSQTTMTPTGEVVPSADPNAHGISDAYYAPPGLLPETPGDHAAHVSENLRRLNIHPVLFAANVKAGAKSMETLRANPKLSAANPFVENLEGLASAGLFGALPARIVDGLRKDRLQGEGPYERISTRDAANQIGRAMGLDPKRSLNLLNRRSREFRLLMSFLSHGRGTSEVPDDEAASTLAAGGSRIDAAIRRAVPDIGKHSGWRLYGDDLSSVLSPASSLRHILGGDLRRPEDRSAWEQIADVGGDIAAFGGLSGLAEKGAASLGELGIKATRGLAGQGFAREMARRQVVRALADEFGKTASGSAMKSGLGSVARRAGSVALDNVAFQAVPTLNHASDLSAENGGSFLDNLPVAAADSARSFVAMHDQRTLFDPTKTPAEKAQTALALYGLGRGAYGLSQARRVNPEFVDDLIESSGGEAVRRVGNVSRGIGVDDAEVGTPRQPGEATRVSALEGVGPYQRSLERLIARKAAEAGLSRKEITRNLGAWRDFAQAWVKGFRGTREDFYRLVRPQLEAVSPNGLPEFTPNAAYLEQRTPGPYEHHKQGDDRSVFSEPDAEYVIARHQNPETGKIPLTVVAADLAKTGSYHNSDTGAWAPGKTDPKTGKWSMGMVGGVEGDLLHDYYGHSAWKSQRPAIDYIGNAIKNSNGLMVAHSTSPDAIFSSFHGSQALKAEMISAVKNGGVTEKQLLDLFRKVYDKDLKDQRAKGDPGRVTLSPDPMSLQSLDDVFRLMSRDQMGMTQRGRLVQKILKKSGGMLPSLKVVRDLLTSPRLRDRKTGETLAVMLADPGQIGLATDFGLPDPAAYKAIARGLSMGLTNGLHITEVIPDQFQRVENLYREKYASRPGFVTKGRVYSGTRKWMSEPWGGNFYGETDAATIRRLAQLEGELRGVAPTTRDLAHEGILGLLDTRDASRVGDRESGDLRSLEPRLRRAGPQGAHQGDDLSRRGMPGESGIDPSGGPGRRLRDGGRGLDDSDIYEQRDAGELRGYTSFVPRGRAVIGLIRGSANAWTLLHESAHVWRRLLAPEQMAALERIYGVQGGRWTVRAEEAFARQVETYFRTGKAPTTTLRRPFDGLRAWLGKAYAGVKGTPAEADLHPEVRATFDRIFAKGYGAERPGAPEAWLMRPSSPFPATRALTLPPSQVRSDERRRKARPRPALALP